MKTLSKEFSIVLIPINFVFIRVSLFKLIFIRQNMSWRLLKGKCVNALPLTVGAKAIPNTVLLILTQAKFSLPK